MKFLYKIQLTNMNIEITLKTIFLSPFIDGQQFVLNAPAWFIPTLYTVEIFYFFIRKISQKTWYNIMIIILFAIINIESIKISGSVAINPIFLPFLKIMFFMFFYILGFYYKIYYEKIDEKINPILTVTLLFIINSIIIKYNSNIHFSSLYSMASFKNVNYVIPMITGITGIYFWIKISQLLQESLKDNKIVNLISNNTKDICMHHIFCMYCVSIIIYLMNFKLHFKSYDVQSFKNSTGWYYYFFNNNKFSIIYFIIGIIGSILIHKISDKIYKFIIRKKLNEKS